MTQKTADAAHAMHKRAIIAIASATGSTSLLVNVWFPFLPLYILQVGARDEAAALLWVAVGMSSLGVGRLIGGPMWGLLSDRLGRKKMFVRAVYFAALTSLVLSIINAPWQVAIALALQGLLSGFVPAAVALTSVSVPDAKVRDALNAVSGAQYLGGAIGPAVGAAMAIAFGYRGAIFTSGLLIAVVATAVIFLVPADTLRKKELGPSGAAIELPPFKPTVQFALAILLYFSLFTLGTFRAVATPIALKDIAGADVTAVTGLAFALGGIASALGVWILSTRFFRKHRLRDILAVTCVLTALAHLLLALSNSVWLYVLAFTLAAFLNASMMPATNTMIALNVTRDRRGTAFGIGSAAQAVAFMVGPMGAAMFATYSLKAGFATVGVLLLALATLVALTLREPQAEK
ncbi:MAG: MFS transporter [Betaproteobacteria bacterium]|nr:MAG: MFS transporter [Betaproteobacteria bacterium]